MNSCEGKKILPNKRNYSSMTIRLLWWQRIRLFTSENIFKVYAYANKYNNSLYGKGLCGTHFSTSLSLKVSKMSYKVKKDRFIMLLRDCAHLGHIILVFP